MKDDPAPPLGGSPGGSDRELLELAAKTVGMPEPDGFHPTAGFVWIKFQDGVRRETRWNPLTDDGDALRLAVKLSIDVLQSETMSIARAVGIETVVEHGDSYAATRRAITRAAAALAPPPSPLAPGPNEMNSLTSQSEQPTTLSREQTP